MRPLHSFLQRALASLQGFFGSLLQDAVTCVRTAYSQEVEAQRSFWDSWKQDPNPVRRLIHLELYFTFTMPMRLWTLCPYPNACIILVSGAPVLLAHAFPGYGTFWTVYAFVMGYPWLEMVAFCVTWYYIPGGKLFLSGFYYGEDNVTLFFGNPVSKFRAAFFGAVAVFSIEGIAIGTNVLWSIGETQVAAQHTQAAAQHAQAAAHQAQAAAHQAQEAMTNVKAINAMARDTVQTWKDSGVEVTKEMVDQARAEAMQAHKAAHPTKGWDITAALRHTDGNVSANVDASHTGNGVKLNGSVTHASTSKPSPSQ